MRLLMVLVLLGLSAGVLFGQGAEEKLLWGFERGEEVAAWEANGELAPSAVRTTQGERALRIAFPEVRPTFGLRAGRGPYDFSGYDKLLLDVFLVGTPMVVTFRVTDTAGDTYTSWYYLLREGRHTIEYSVLGMASRVDLSRVDRFWFTAESSLPAATYMVEQEPTGERVALGARSAVLYLDNVRLHRGPQDDTWLLPPPEAKPPLTVPGNLIENGDFEWGFWNWGSWGTWDSGSYLFERGTGEDAHTGASSAAIVSQKVGRGGIWTQKEIQLVPGEYTLSMWVKARGPGVRMFYGLEREGSGAVTEGKTSDRFSVPQQWTEKRFEVRVAEPGGPVALYLYNVGSDTLYIDDVALVGEAAPAGKAAPAVKGKPTVVTVRGEVIYVNGEPFFPLGFYHGDPAGYEGTGFNFTTGRAGRDVGEFLDEAARYGVYAQVALEGLMRAHVPEKVVEVARRYKNHPALLAWYVCDEPDHMRWNVPPPEMRLATKLLHQEDPNHPTWAVVMPWADSNLYQYANTVDILASDVYPIGTSRPLTKVARTMDVMRRAHRGPSWMVPQATAKATPQEEYLVTYLALTHGAAGIVYWEYDGARKNPLIWETMKRISLEIKELTPALTSPTSQREVRASNEHIHLILKETPEAYYLITVSDSKEPLGEVTLRVPWLTQSTEARVMFEDRAVLIEGGKLIDRFDTYQRHVYRIGR